MDDERPPGQPGRPTGHERHAWTEVPPTSRSGEATPADEGAAETGPRGPVGVGAAAMGAGVGGALAGDARSVPAGGRDTVGEADVADTAGRTESIGAGDEGT